MSYRKTPQPFSIVAPPPSAGSQKGGTNLDAALLHLRPNIERLLPRAGKDEETVKSDAGRKPKP